MLRWPWFTTVVAVLALVSPPAQSLFHGAFQSGEALSRNIAAPIFYAGAAILLLLAAIEWFIRWRVSQGRAAAGSTGSDRAVG